MIDRFISSLMALKTGSFAMEAVCVVCAVWDCPAIEAAVDTVEATAMQADSHSTLRLDAAGGLSFIAIHRPAEGCWGPVGSASARTTSPSSALRSELSGSPEISRRPAHIRIRRRKTH